ncbi:MAG TPA: ABC transporter permease [Solirubrobacteraceae bacterium]|nr:ABC transporter permease [Solirubrobacteraceae bacterium]
MRPSTLLYFYRRRLRVHAVQELFAGIGIAVAVALVFAALVAEGSVAGSAGEVVHAMVGGATLQLRARDGDGFDERLLTRVEHLAGVKQAAPRLEQSATVIARDGRRTPVNLAGTGSTSPSPAGIGLSKTTADALGIAGSGSQADEVTLSLRGRGYTLKVAGVLGPKAVGALSRALIAVMPLGRVQELAGLHGRITRILVWTEPGREAAVRAELQTLAGGRLTVAPADQDVTLLRQALRPSDLASGLFAAISALLGFLLAFAAMLLTAPERRRAIAELRIAGAKRTAIVKMVLFQALCLGLVASLVGLLAGYALSVGVFHQHSQYLAEAFTLAGGTVVGARPVLVSVIGGVLTTCLASAIPLLDLRSGGARDTVYVQDGVPDNAFGKATQRRLFAISTGLIALASVLFVLAPAAALGATGALALATMLAVPLVFAGVLRATALVAEHHPKLTSVPVALASLKATTLRSLALAATGAVALFGSVALGGSRDSLLRGIEGFSHGYGADANVWVTNPGDNQATDDFSAGRDRARIARLPAVANVRAFQGGFLQLGDRRVWIIARPPGGGREVLKSQIVDGDVTGAIARLGEGGWIAVSQNLAEERHAGVGSTLALPTPTGEKRFGIAATITNLAWGPGAILMDSADYSRDWRVSAPTALGVDLRPGADASQARSAIERVLGPASGLEVSLARTREATIDSLTSEGLSQLGEISTLLVFAAIVAMAAALGSNMWQRRAWLAGLRLSGAKPQRLRRILLIEAALMLGAGCLTGAAVGIYGQDVIDAYLKRVTGFPLAGAITGVRPFEIFMLVLAGALTILIVPGWFAARVSPMLALREE